MRLAMKGGDGEREKPEWMVWVEGVERGGGILCELCFAAGEGGGRGRARMLWERWQEVLERKGDRVAIRRGGEVWTFADLERESVRGGVEGVERHGQVVVGRGGVVEMVLAVLKAWSGGWVFSPVEKGGVFPGEPQRMPEGVAHLKWTPGNEGRPRAVYFSEAQVAADGDRLVRAMGMAERDEVVNVAVISVGHSYGFSQVVLPLLLHGVAVREVEVPFPRVVAEVLADEEAVMLPAVPSMWRAWERAGILGVGRMDLALSAGAPLAMDLEARIFGRWGVKVRNFYGATECGGIAWDGGDGLRADEEVVGRLLPGVEVEVVDGRILVRSDAVAMGYELERAGERLGHGAFLTPDFGWWRDGVLGLRGSGGESINVAGRKVGPARIEAVLRACGAERVRVFGVPSVDRERVEEIVALVESAVGWEEIRRRAAEQLAGWELPRQWRYAGEEVDWELPRRELSLKYRSR